MSQEAKIIALEHLVFSLLQELEMRSGLQSQYVVDRALNSIELGEYPFDKDQKKAVAGAIKDAVSLIKPK